MSQNRDLKNEEIDLLDLFRRMGRAIVSAINAIGKGSAICIVFLFRRWLPLTISLIIAIGFTYLMKKSFTPYYSSNMLIKSNTVANADMMTYLNRLHSFCNEKNTVALSSALSIPPERVEGIKDIQAFWVIDKNKDGTPDFIDYRSRFNVYDTVDMRMQDRIIIRAQFASIGDIEGLRKGIFSFVNSNEYYKKQNDIRLVQVDEMITRLNYDIDKLDSLQKIKYFEETKNLMPGKNGQMIFLQEQKTQLIYDDIHRLVRSKQSLDQEKKLNPEIITMLSDFSIPAKPFTGMVYYGKMIIPLFLGLTILCLILIANRKRLKDFYRKY